MLIGEAVFDSLLRLQGLILRGSLRKLSRWLQCADGSIVSTGASERKHFMGRIECGRRGEGESR
jgi:hypothetical protein